ncbi:probable serine/threonine-protein kinase nek3 isoform X2 [Aphidius gifuensis]|uniref:probable serine/threonine-protein kinase nek3 isoform X2 n=1 Tax=Aphidius gifuensis TaxID=684658 RepID=UPI001CDB87B9|nr:probable serine/threonine-protein kinase nek3 isoform X2 [Aphidius gifuensis]
MSSNKINETNSDNIILSGQLKKASSIPIVSVKSVRKKFFVLRGDRPGQSPSLEYYDSKKKFINQQPPKRCIQLRGCYDISRKDLSKNKRVIALYAKEECVSLIFDNEEEVKKWFDAIQSLTGDGPDGEEPRPTFEHVWHVSLQKKGLGEKQNLHGPFRLRLTDKTLSMTKITNEQNSDYLEFPLTTIRRCGCMDRIFYMEVGRSAMTGEGDYWMKAEDNNIATNMHFAIMNAMTRSKERDKDDILPQARKRSSSANEASKPISFIPRRHTGQKIGFSPVGTTTRDRCDSLPSRARTTSEGYPVMPIHNKTVHLAPHTSTRPHSMYGRGVSYSPPGTSMPISPASCSTDSAGSSLSMDDNNCDNNAIEETAISRYGHSLTPDEPVIFEENDDYAIWSNDNQMQKYSLNFKSHSPCQQSSYVEMHSPSNSSPGQGGDLSSYLPMSPATHHHHHHHNNQHNNNNHSRTSSLVEDITLSGDGYVPMAPLPITNTGYIDMDRSSNHNNGHYSDDMSQHGSTCSVTSGTPSTDSRLIGYSLDKVTSFLPPIDDLRPARAYSVGSRQDQSRKNRFEPFNNDTSRVRAFSVGSRTKHPELSRLQNAMIIKKQTSVENINPNKSNSAPLLSSSWGHNSVASDRMEDLMEMDFSKTPPTTIATPPPTTTTPTTTILSPLSSFNTQLPINTAIDTSSYVDMIPGLSTVTTTASFIDRSRINKANITTANHNHNYLTMTTASTTILTATSTPTTTTPPSSVVAHKPIVQTLMPVVESEGLNCNHVNNLQDEWPKLETIPKQSESYLNTKGPAGIARTPPVDLPQPRKPPEGYVEMSFKTRPCLEQNYMNMSIENTSKYRRNQRAGSRKDKCNRSHSISTKYTKNSCFLQLNGNNNIVSTDSADNTPVSTPQSITTPTGSNTTIFPFTLNSPQSPIKSFNISDKSAPTSSDCSPDIGDYALMTSVKHPLTAISSPIEINNDKKLFNRPESPIKQTINKTIIENLNLQKNDIKTSPQQQQQQQQQNNNDLSLSPLNKKLSDLTIKKKNNLSKNTTSPVTVTSNNNNNLKDDNNIKLTNDINKKIINSTNRDFKKTTNELLLQNPVTKKLTELTISKTKLIGSSPNTSPTLIGQLKILPTKTLKNSNDDGGGGVSSATTTTTATITNVNTITTSTITSSSSSSSSSSSAPTITTATIAATTTTTSTTTSSSSSSSQLDSEGYEKLQPGATMCNYASLDLPESSSVPPLSPTPAQDGFRYAEIDFAKLKQN